LHADRDEETVGSQSSTPTKPAVTTGATAAGTIEITTVAISNSTDGRRCIPVSPLTVNGDIHYHYHAASPLETSTQQDIGRSPPILHIRPTSSSAVSTIVRRILVDLLIADGICTE
jgi:hypothetical protein